jgi:hypothetical protein
MIKGFRLIPSAVCTDAQTENTYVPPLCEQS